MLVPTTRLPWSSPDDQEISESPTKRVPWTSCTIRGVTRTPGRRTVGRSASFDAYRSSSVQASQRMQKNVRSGGRAERVLRSVVWRSGMRFRIHVGGLPGKPDLVFSRQRVCVFCDGDFWHGRRWAKQRAAVAGRANASYWLAKIETNRARDKRTNRALRARGWRVVRLWESDVLKDPIAAAARVALELQRRNNIR